MSAWVHAPSVWHLTGSSPSIWKWRRSRSRWSRYGKAKPKVNPRSPMAASSSSLVRIAVVGDVHGYWNLEEDTKALQLLQPDLVLFTGDFGEENVELVQSVANLQFAKAVILGNHDAWRTREFRKKKSGVELQLEALGDEHVGYRRLDFPSLKISVVGGRPFSHGGDRLFRSRLLVQRYGVQDLDVSAARIVKAASGTPEDHLLIILAHNGPTGLGSKQDDICGKDWVDEAGDHGDPDLEQALSKLNETGKLYVPLVVFGHMHKELQSGNKVRKMIAFGTDNTIYLNSAVVPRVKRLNNEHTDTSGESFMKNDKLFSTSDSENTARAFTVVEIVDGKVDKIAETWVEVAGERTQIKEEYTLFESNGS